MHPNRLPIWVGGYAVLLLQSIATASILYVTPLGTGDCTSWQSPCSLSTAVSGAASGDQVWLKSGQYGPISLKSGVRLIGGFAGTESDASQSSPSSNVTIIDGGGARAILSQGNGPGTVIRGVTIRNGDAGGDLQGGGGAMLVDSSAMFVDCLFEANTAGFFGGAVAIHGTGAPSFVNCEFRGNGRFASNTTIAGGAIFVESGGVTVVNSLFVQNSAGEGGAIASLGGTCTLLNSTLFGNSATIGSGGAINDPFGGMIVKNSILWDNTAVSTGAQIYNDTGVASSVSHSNVQGGWTSGTSIIDTNPLFAQGYRLGEGSPCVNAGSNSHLPSDGTDLDWDGNLTESIPFDLARLARKASLIVDMGAYERPVGSGSQ